MENGARFRLQATAVVALLCGPAYAEQLAPAVGQGYYDGFGLDGPARATVRQWLHDTIVDCEKPESPGVTHCRLDGITSGLSIAYIGPPSDPQRTVVAFVSDNPDNGNIFHGVVGLWHREADGFVGGRFLVSDDVPIGQAKEIDGVVSYEAEAMRFMPAIEPTIHYRLSLVDDGHKLRTEQVGPKRVIPDGPPVMLAPTEDTPITSAVDTHGADAPVRSLLALGDEIEGVFFPQRGQPNRMSEFLDKRLIDAWNAARPAMRAEPLLDGNPVTGTQDTHGLRMLSLALGYHEGRMATIVATVRANVGGEERTFPVNFNVLNDNGAWKILNIKPGKNGSFLFSTLETIADKWKRQHPVSAPVAPPAPAPRMANLVDAGMPLTEPRFRGEWGLTFEHNGSEMTAFPKAGLIAYVKPKASLSGTVRPGDVIYQGTLTPHLSGTAYVFKAGCTPSPYHVAGTWMRPGAIDFGFTLRGHSPIRQNGGCGVTGFSATSPNAVLRFDSALETDG